MDLELSKNMVIMEKHTNLDDGIYLVTKKIDCNGSKYLMFYKSGEKLSQVPSGYRLVIHLEEGSEEEQEPFCGTFILSWERSYSLRLHGITKVRFVQTKEHHIQVL